LDILAYMRVLVGFILLVLLLIVLDSLVRFIYIWRLKTKINRREEHRQRFTELGNGKKTISIALIGDSVLYGEGSNYQLPAIGHVAHQLTKQGYRVTVSNYAITGDTISGALQKQLPKALNADLIFIYVGANDYFHFSPVEDFGASVDKALEALTDKTVIWCTLADPLYLYPLPIWLRHIYHFYAKSYTHYIVGAISKHPKQRWYIVDFLNEVPKRIATQKLKKRVLLTDGFHLSEFGHEFWCSIVADGYTDLKHRKALLP
jgi:lysophospholipase L1-like esterase